MGGAQSRVLFRRINFPGISEKVVPGRRVRGWGGAWRGKGSERGGAYGGERGARWARQGAGSGRDLSGVGGAWRPPRRDRWWESYMKKCVWGRLVSSVG